MAWAILWIRLVLVTALLGATSSVQLRFRTDADTDGLTQITRSLSASSKPADTSSPEKGNNAAIGAKSLPLRSPVEVPLVPWNPRSPPVVDIFVRSYPGDGHWLTFMLRSVAKFVPRSMYRNLILTYNESDHAFFSSFAPAFDLPIVLAPRVDPHVPFVVPPYSNYYAQIYQKLMTDTFSDADYFLHVDSDVSFSRAVTLDDFMDTRGRIYLYPFSFHALAPHFHFWKNASEKMLQEKVGFEIMTRMPFFFPRDAYANLRNRVEALHGKPFLQAVMGLGPFNEFTPLGVVLMKHMPGRCHRRHYNHERFALQMRSWNGLDPYTVVYLECLLQAKSSSQCTRMRPPPAPTTAVNGTQP